MDVFDWIRTRRSIRRFFDKLEEIIFSEKWTSFGKEFEIHMLLADFLELG